MAHRLWRINPWLLCGFLVLTTVGCARPQPSVVERAPSNNPLPRELASRVTKYDEVRVKLEFDLQHANVGAFREFAEEAQPAVIDRQIKRISSGLNDLSITRPQEEEDKNSALIQFSSDTDINSNFGHLLFWPKRWEKVPGEATAPRGLVVLHELDAAKADLKLYVSAETSRRQRNMLEVIVQPPEDRADYQCSRQISYAEAEAREIKLSEIIAACAVAIAVRSRTDTSDPRNAANRNAYRPPYTLYLDDPIPGGQDQLLLGIVEYAKYIRTRVEPNTVAAVRSAGLDALSNAVRLLSGGDESTPLRSYLFVHAGVTLCEEQGRSCVHEDARKNELVKQALKSPLFADPGARQTKALAEEMMAEFDEAAKIWTQLAQDRQPAGAPDRVAALSRQSEVRIRIARRLRETGALWPALIKHSLVLRDLLAEPNPPWNRAEQQKLKSLAAQIQNARLEVATDKLRIVELAQTLASAARDHRAVVDFGINGMRRIFTDVVVDGPQGPTLAAELTDPSITWAAEQLLPLRGQQTCVDQTTTQAESTADSCAALRQQIDVALTAIAARFQAEALTALRDLLASAAADTSSEARTPLSAARQRDLAYKVYLVACQDQKLWSQEGARSDELVAQAAASTPNDAERKRLLVALSRCRLQALLRDTGWPDTRWLTLAGASPRRQTSALADLAQLVRQGELEAQPVANLLHYPALWAAVDAYVRWVHGSGDQALKEWIVRAAQAQDFADWDRVMSDMWKDFVPSEVVGKAVQTIADALAIDHREARITKHRANLLELTEQTFVSWARTQPALGSPRSSMFEALSRLQQAREGLLKAAFEDLEVALEPLTRDLAKLEFPEQGAGASQSALLFHNLDERIAGASALAFIRIYDELAGAGRLNVAVTTTWLQQQRGLVAQLIGKIEDNAVARWPEDNPAVISLLEREWEKQKGSRLTAAELSQKREKEARAAVRGVLHGSQRIEDLAHSKVAELVVRFHGEPSLDQLRRSELSTLVSSTQAATRILESQGQCKKGMEDLTESQRLDFFLAHVGLHRERYLAAVLPDGIRSETRSLTRAYEAWCNRMPQSTDLVMLLARQRPGFLAESRASSPLLSGLPKLRHASRLRGEPSSRRAAVDPLLDPATSRPQQAFRPGSRGVRQATRHQAKQL